MYNGEKSLSGGNGSILIRPFYNSTPGNFLESWAQWRDVPDIRRARVTGLTLVLTVFRWRAASKASEWGFRDSDYHCFARPCTTGSRIIPKVDRTSSASRQHIPLHAASIRNIHVLA